MKMLSVLLRFILPVILSLTIASSVLGAVRLDDSTSPRNRVQAIRVLNEHGRLLENDLHAKFAVLQFGNIEYRLATAAYIGQKANIYYVVPLSVDGLLSPSALTVSWSANDAFSEGSAHAGDRVHVWAGVIDSQWLTPGLNLVVQVELDKLNLSENTNFGFESYFEIEVLP